MLINWRCHPKSSGNGPGMGKSNMELGTPREAIAERNLGIRMDHKLPVPQQQEGCVAEKPNPEHQPLLWDALPGAWQVCNLISLFSSVMRKPD